MKAFLQFSKGERNGALLLITLIVAVKLAPYLAAKPHFEQDASSFAEEVRLFRESAQDTVPATDAPRANLAPKHLAQPFPFDPNTADSATLVSLGLPPWVAKSMLKYRSKGGRFRTKEDVKKIYNLKPEDYEKIAPYIHIEAENTAQLEQGEQPAWANKRYGNENKQRAVAPIEVNSADEEAWGRLPGIGPSYAKRIIKFRDALGGFVAANQVAETFAMPDSVFQKIKPYLTCDPANIKRIDLNSATFEQLEAHPYLHKGHATQILRHRERNGPFRQVEELQILSAFDDGKDTFGKIKAYIIIK